MVRYMEKAKTVRALSAASASFVAPLATDIPPYFDMEKFLHLACQIRTTGSAGLTSSAQIEVSLDGENWATAKNESGTTIGTRAITADGTEVINIPNCGWLFARLSVTISAGSANFEVKFSGKDAG